MHRLVSLTGKTLCSILVAEMPVRCAYLCQACGPLTLVTVSGPVVLINYCTLQVPGDAAPFPWLHGDTSQGTVPDLYGSPEALRL